DRPLGRCRVLLLDRLQRPRDGALSAPGEEVDRARLSIEQQRLDQIGPGRVLRDVAVELYIPPPDLRLQLGGRGVVSIVHPEVRVHLLVVRDGEVDEMLVRSPAPGLTRT